MHRRNFLQLGLGAALGTLGGGHLALAQAAYPARPVKLIVPFAPGGLVDIIGRMWGDKVKDGLGIVIVQNEGGAGGTRGAATVAHADADGYTILLGNSSTQVLTPAAMTNPPYDAHKDFVAVSIICVSATCIVVNPELPVKNLAELVAYAKANPGKLSYGSAGAGSMTNLAGELFKKLAGTPDVVHIPYKGAAPATSDVMSGQIPMLTPNITAQLLSLHKAGKVRILAVNAPKRLQAAQDIPTAVEAGLPGMELQVFNGLFAPAKTPAPVVAKLSAATQAALADAEFQKRLLSSGFEPAAPGDAAAAQRYVDAEAARLTPLIKSVGFKLD